jgi:hypothetical protein
MQKRSRRGTNCIETDGEALSMTFDKILSEWCEKNSISKNDFYNSILNLESKKSPKKAKKSGGLPPALSSPNFSKGVALK